MLVLCLKWSIIFKLFQKIFEKQQTTHFTFACIITIFSILHSIVQY
jgi:hypothetical protein